MTPLLDSSTMLLTRKRVRCGLTHSPNKHPNGQSLASKRTLNRLTTTGSLSQQPVTGAYANSLANASPALYNSIKSSLSSSSSSRPRSLLATISEITTRASKTTLGSSLSPLSTPAHTVRAEPRRHRILSELFGLKRITLSKFRECASAVMSLLTESFVFRTIGAWAPKHTNGILA